LQKWRFLIFYRYSFFFIYKTTKIADSKGINKPDSGFQLQ
jgi:hypothetical protein